MARAPKFQRAKVIAIINREVRRIMKTEDDPRILDDVLTHGLAWCKNTHSYTYDLVARALIALAPIAERRDLEHVADSLVSHTEERKGPGHEERARRILAPLGVRYAACGCLEVYAGDQCCDKGVAAADERKSAIETRKQSILEALAKRPELLDQWLRDGEQRAAARRAS